MKHLALAAGTRLTSIFIAVAAASAAELGMKAPPLEIAEWVKGSPVDPAADRGKRIFVVEFWATWCPPCRESIPHLTELQKKFGAKGVVIVGVTDEELKVVKPFVSRMGAKMDYTVAIDRETKTWEAYMRAFGYGGIPHAFVVNKDGVIAWEGHPRAGLDEALEQIVDGKYDLEGVKFAQKFAEELHEYLHLASDGDSPLARAAGRKLFDAAAQRPNLLNDLAWEILTHEHDLQFRDRRLALDAARAANQATGGRDPDILDTYALALFENGNAVEAVQIVKQAIALCQDDSLRPQFKERLERYEKGLK